MNYNAAGGYGTLHLETPQNSDHQLWEVIPDAIQVDFEHRNLVIGSRGAERKAFAVPNGKKDEQKWMFIL